MKKALIMGEEWAIKNIELENYDGSCDKTVRTIILNSVLNEQKKANWMLKT